VGGFYRIQVLALDILDQGEFEHPRVIYILNDYRNFDNSGQFRGAPSSFTGYDLVAVLMLADNDRLDDPIRTNRRREFLQPVGLKDRAGLHWIGADAG
jgi:hypothetical protein